MAQRMAGVFGFVAFTAVCIQALFVGASFEEAIWRAWTCMLLFGVLGLIVGALAKRSIEESLQAQVSAAIDEAVGDDTGGEQSETPKS